MREVAVYKSGNFGPTWAIFVPELFARWAKTLKNLYHSLTLPSSPFSAQVLILRRHLSSKTLYQSLLTENPTSDKKLKILLKFLDSDLLPPEWIFENRTKAKHKPN